MELEFFGANCFRVTTKNASVVIDDNLVNLGAKSIVKDAEVVFFTQKILENDAAKNKARLVIDSAGEFEVGDLSVKALQTRAHMDEEGVESATVYQFMYGGKTVTILGHVHPDISGALLELAGGTDVLVLPVGGNGYTLDAVGATSVIKKIEPDVVIPSHYEDAQFNFEIPQSPLDEFIKTAALQTTEKKDSYRLDKPETELIGQTHIVLLNAKTK
jgi:L-ascorbate metabolism protein UlaG (beta-lactamase superfamily)